MKNCETVGKRRDRNTRKGEKLMVTTNDAGVTYVASPDDLSRAVCCQTGDQFNLPISPALQRERGLTPTVRATLKSHKELRHHEEDTFTVNGTTQKLVLSQVKGMTIELLPGNTQRVSTYEAFPLNAAEAATAATTPTTPESTTSRLDQPPTSRTQQIHPGAMLSAGPESGGGLSAGV